MTKFLLGFVLGIVACISFIYFIYFNNKLTEDTATTMRRGHQESIELVVGFNPDEKSLRMAYINGNYTITFVELKDYENFVEEMRKLVKDR